MSGVFHPGACAAPGDRLQGGRLLRLLAASLHQLLLAAAAAQRELRQRVPLQRAGRVPAALAPCVLGRSWPGGGRSNCGGAGGPATEVHVRNGQTEGTAAGFALIDHTSSSQWRPSRVVRHVHMLAHLPPAAACAPPAVHWAASPCTALPAGAPCSTVIKQQHECRGSAHGQITLLRSCCRSRLACCLQAHLIAWMANTLKSRLRCAAARSSGCCRLSMELLLEGASAHSDVEIDCRGTEALLRSSTVCACGRARLPAAMHRQQAGLLQRLPSQQ